MARGKFNKRGGGPRLDAVSAEEIEIRNRRLAELEEERAARRAAEEEDGEEGGEDGKGDLEAIDETKEATPDTSKPKADKKAAAEPTKAAMTTQAEHNKNIARLAEVRRRREEAEARRKAEEEAANQLEEERKKMAAMALEEAQEQAEVKSKKSSKKVIPKIDKITIKKMKPALLKEALKERDLEIQGNAKELQQRLMDYESKR